MTAAESTPQSSHEQLSPEAQEFSDIITDRFDAHSFEAATDNPYEVELGVALDASTVFPFCIDATVATLIRDYPGGDKDDQGELTGPRIRVYNPEDKGPDTIFYVRNGDIWKKTFSDVTTSADYTGPPIHKLPRSKEMLHELSRRTARSLGAPVEHSDGRSVNRSNSQEFRNYGEPLSPEQSRQAIDALKGAQVVV